MQKLVNPPTKKGDRFKSDAKKGVFTANYFFGSTGIPYGTLEEAQKNNPHGENLLVDNVERGGCTFVYMSHKI